MNVTKKRVVIGGTVAALVLGTTGVAYAYFTTTGTGTGTAAVGTSTGVTLAATTTGALTPGGTTGDVTFTVSNSASGPQRITTVHLAGVTASNPSCDVSAFSMADVTQNFDAPVGASTLPVHGVLQMADNGLNQDACKGVALTLSLTSS